MQIVETQSDVELRAQKTREENVQQSAAQKYKFEFWYTTIQHLLHLQQMLQLKRKEHKTITTELYQR